MFSNPLLLSRRRCYRRLHLRLLPGCRYRLSIHACCRAAAFAFASATTSVCCRAFASACCRVAAVVASINACCLRFRLRDHLRLFPGFCLRRLHPLPGCRLHLRPLPSCRRLRLLSGCLSCNTIVCVYYKLGNVQTFGLFVLAVKSRRERFARPSRNRSGLATTDNSATARKSLSYITTRNYS